MTTNVLVTDLSLSTIIGITVGSGLILISVVLAFTITLLHRRHKHALQELERGLLQKFSAANLQEPSETMNTSCSGDANLERFNQESAKMHDELLAGSMTMNSADYRRHKRRSSERLILPPAQGRPPATRRPSSRSMATSRLSAVIESPIGQTQSKESSHAEIESRGHAHRGDTTSPSAKGSGDQPVAKEMPSWQLGHATWPLVQRKKNSLPVPQLPAFRTPSMKHYKPERAFSLPTILAPLQDDAVFGTTSHPPRAVGAQRSVSHGTLNFLERARQHDHHPRLNIDIGFNSDYMSRSGFPAASATSPNCRAEDVSHFKDGKTPPSAADQICTADSVRLSKVYNGPGQTEPITVIRVLSTPKRDAQRRQVSACGSPPEKAHAAVLRDISGNGFAPSREISQTSFFTHSTDDNVNPFKWEVNPFKFDSPVQTRRSALKGSPTSKNARKRQSNNVRIISAPTVHEFSRQSTQSALDASDVSLDGNVDVPTGIRICKDNSRSYEEESVPMPLPRTPSTRVFAPELRLRASLTRTSATLQTMPYQQEIDIPQALNFPKYPRRFDAEYDQDDSKDVLSTIPSACSSVPATPPTSDLAVIDSSFIEVPLDPPDSPTLGVLPGLTLIARQNKMKLESKSRTTLPPSTHEPKAPTKEASSLISALDMLETIDEHGWPPVSNTSPSVGPITPDLKQDTVIVLDDIPVDRLTPLSSTVDPSNTDTNGLPEKKRPKNSVHPLGPREKPAAKLARNIVLLRRENSDAMHHMTDHREVQRYMNLGRRDGPVIEFEDIENEFPANRTISPWDDGERFWDSYEMKKTTGKMPFAVAKLSPLRTEKVLATGMPRSMRGETISLEAV